MHIHSIGNRYAVLDDVLADNSLRESAVDCYEAGLRPVLSTVNPYHDGFAFRAQGPAIKLANPESNRWQDALGQAVLDGLSQLDIQPTGVIEIDSLYWSYPAGVKLSWHDDGHDRVAAFIFYLSPRWRASWGGELDIIDADIDMFGSPVPGRGVDDIIIDSKLNATAVFPRPNRLVVVKARTFHRIRRVDQLAGDTSRMSLSGFVPA